MVTSLDVEYGPDGEPFDPTKDYSEYESNELAWMQDAVIRLLMSPKFHTMTSEQQVAVVNRLQEVCLELGEDFVEEAYVEETLQEFGNS